MGLGVRVWVSGFVEMQGLRDYGRVQRHYADNGEFAGKEDGEQHGCVRLLKLGGYMLGGPW